MPDVVVAALFRDAGLHGQHRRLAFQRLRLGFFIDAQHHGLVRRVEVQAGDVADLGFQLRVGGELEALRPPRLQSPFPPHVRDLDVGDAQLGGQQPGRPVRHSQPPGRRLQGGQHDGHIIGGPRLARPGPVLQPAGALGGVPLLPQDHRRLGHPGPPRDLIRPDPVRRPAARSGPAGPARPGSTATAPTRPARHDLAAEPPHSQSMPSTIVREP